MSLSTIKQIQPTNITDLDRQTHIKVLNSLLKDSKTAWNLFFNTMNQKLSSKNPTIKNTNIRHLFKKAIKQNASDSVLWAIKTIQPTNITIKIECRDMRIDTIKKNVFGHILTTIFLNPVFGLNTCSGMTKLVT